MADDQRGNTSKWISCLTLFELCFMGPGSCYAWNFLSNLSDIDFIYGNIRDRRYYKCNLRLIEYDHKDTDEFILLPRKWCCYSQGTCAMSLIIYPTRFVQLRLCGKYIWANKEAHP